MGFFGSALLSVIGNDILPENFEWPVGKSKNVIHVLNKYYVVPHLSTNRVQVYNNNLEFIRGWNIEAGGGVFKIQNSDSNILIYTARGDNKYLYDINGKLLLSEKYTEKGQTYSSFFLDGQTVNIPTPVPLLVFSSPFLSWLCAVIGILLYIQIDKFKMREKKHHLS